MPKSKKIQPKKFDVKDATRLQAETIVARLLRKIRSGEVEVESVGEWGNNAMDTEFTTKIIWTQNEKN